MFKVAQGIDVFYKNDKYVVHWNEGNGKAKREYQLGGMLLELISDEAYYLMVTKPENMIRCFPDAEMPVSVESVTSGFKWLYGTVEDEELPLATELFRGTFNLCIMKTFERGGQYENVRDFFLECYQDYLKDIQRFAIYVDAVASAESNLADEFNRDRYSDFCKIADEVYDIYSKNCSKRQKRDQVKYEVYTMLSCMDVLWLEYCRLKKLNKGLRICHYCGRYFIPKAHKDAKYCFYMAPDGNGKTCAEVASQKNQSQKRRNDPSERDYNRQRAQLGMAAHRAREAGIDDSHYQKKLNEVLEHHGKRDNEN